MKMRHPRLLTGVGGVSYISICMSGQHLRAFSKESGRRESCEFEAKKGFDESIRALVRDLSGVPNYVSFFPLLFPIIIIAGVICKAYWEAMCMCVRHRHH